MEQLHCPHCQSDQIDSESRLAAADNSTSVGRWRIKYGLISAFFAGVFGLLCLLASWLWLEPPLDEPALIIAVLSILFAAFVLGTTIYFWRWSEVTQYTCRVCQLSWVEGIDPS